MREFLQAFRSEHFLLYEIFISLLIVFAFFVFSKIINFLLNRYISKLVEKTRTEVDDKLLEVSKAPIRNIFLVAGVYFALKNIERHPELFEKVVYYLKYANTFLFLITVLIVVLFSLKVTKIFTQWLLEREEERENKIVKKEFVPIINKVVSVFIYLLAVAVILQHFHKDISSIVVSLGIGSLAIGLAAQDTLANMIAGIFIMIDRPFRIGDRVKLETGEMGDVVDIGLRSTKIATFDHTILIVPNSIMAKSKLTNYCYPDERIKIKITVSVSYGSDPEKVRDTLVEIIKNTEGIVDDPEPAIFFTNMGDFSIDFLIIAWTDDYRNQFSIKCNLLENVYKGLSERGIEIPFPTQTIYVRNK